MWLFGWTAGTMFPRGTFTLQNSSLAICPPFDALIEHLLASYPYSRKDGESHERRRDEIPF